jgi:hypothetical protein
LDRWKRFRPNKFSGGVRAVSLAMVDVTLTVLVERHDQLHSIYDGLACGVPVQRRIDWK